MDDHVSMGMRISGSAMVMRMIVMDMVGANKLEVKNKQMAAEHLNSMVRAQT